MQHESEATKKATLEVNRNIQRASWLLVGSILISRVIGFVREIALAKTVGASGLTDVYYASFTIPDFLNYLTATGALSISFIPILSGFLSRGEVDLGKKVFRTLAFLMGAFLTALVIVAEIFAEKLSLAVAPGFSGEQLATLTYLTRIILPAQIFIFWGGLATSVQHTHGKFLIPALSPIVYNASIIFFGVLLHRSYGVAGFSVGVLVGAILGHGALQWLGIAKLGYSAVPYVRLDDDIKPAVKRYFWLSLPIMLGFSLVITDEWISKFFASSLGARAITWLSFARTEMRIPIAVIGQAAGVASFPYLSRLWSQGNFDQYGKTLLRELSKLWAAAPVAGILLLGHALPITHAIYGGSRLTPEDLVATAQALQFMSVGMVFWIFQMVLARGFYACQQTWWPPLIGTILSVIFIPLYQRLGISMGHRGLALAGSIGITVYTLILMVTLHRYLKQYCLNLSLTRFLKFCFLWSFVVLALWFVSDGISRLGIYRDTRFSAVVDVGLTTLVLAGVSIVLLRKVFTRFTDGALY